MPATASMSGWMPLIKETLPLIFLPVALSTHIIWPFFRPFFLPVSSLILIKLLYGLIAAIWSSSGCICVELPVCSVSR